MSVSRKTLSEVIGVPEYNVRCKKCHYYNPQKVGHKYADFCNFWRLSCKAEEFCSFYIPKKDMEAGLRGTTFAEMIIDEGAAEDGVH